MKKILKILTIFFIILIIVFNQLPRLLNNEQYKAQIITFFEKNLGINLKINGDLEISVIPFYIIAEDVEITKDEEAGYVNHLKLDFNMSSILSKNLTPKGITISNSQLAYNFIQTLYLDLNSLLHNSFSRITIKNSIIKDYRQNADIEDININMYTTGLVSQSGVQVNGSFIINETQYQVAGNIDDIRAENTKVKFNINNESYYLGFDGYIAYLLQSTNRKIDGSLNFRFIHPNLPKKDMINFTTKVSLSNQEYKIFDSQLSSDIADNISTNIQLDLMEKGNGIADITIGNIDFDKLIDVKAEDENKHPAENFLARDVSFFNFFEILINNFNFSINPNISANINCKVQNIKYKDNKIENLATQMEIDNGIIKITDSKISLFNNIDFSFVGTIDSNEVRPKLEGSFELTASDLKALHLFSEPLEVDNNIHKIHGNLMLIPYYISFYDINTNIDNIKLNGKFSIHGGQNTVPTIDTSFSIDGLDAKKFGIESIFDQAIYTLYKTDYDKSGEIFTKNVNDFHFLRNLAYDFDFNLDFNNLIFKGQNIDRMNTMINIYKNNFNIERLEINADTLDLTLQSKMNLLSFRPKIHGTLHIKTIDFDKLQNILPPSGTLYDKMMQDFNQNKATILSVSDVENYQDSTAAKVTREINFLGMHNYDIDLDLTAQKLVIGDTDFKDIKATLSLNNGQMLIDEIYGTADTGNFNLKVEMNSFNIIPSFAMAGIGNNMNLKNLINYINGFNGIDGHMNISFALNASGENWDKVKRNIQGKVAVAGRKVKLLGFNIDNIIKFIESKSSLNDKIKGVEYFSSNDQTEIELLRGKMDISYGVADIDGTMESIRFKGASIAKYDFLTNEVNSISKFSFIPIGHNQQILNFQIESQGNLSRPKNTVNNQMIIQYIGAQAGQSGRNIDNIISSRR